MRSVTLTPEGLVASYLRLGEQYPAAIRRGLLSASLRAIPALQKATRQAQPASPDGVGQGGAVNTGAYLRAWKSRPVEDGFAVTNDSPYSGIIEQGRAPGGKMPPIEPIARWAQRRLGLSRDKAQGVAFAIAKRIQKRGLAARQVLQLTTPELLIILRAEIDRELGTVSP